MERIWLKVEGIQLCDFQRDTKKNAAWATVKMGEKSFVIRAYFFELEKDGRRFTILNVMGQTFFKNAYPSPFDALDQALTKADPDSIILLDVHAETTSEKALISRYADGRVSAVWGSHTHVPTADERILPGGTAFMTDVGLTGAHNESIGIEYEKALTLVKDGVKTHLAPPYSGPAEVNAALLFFKSGNRLPASIKRLREIVTVLPN